MNVGSDWFEKFILGDDEISCVWDLLLMKFNNFVVEKYNMNYIVG